MESQQRERSPRLLVAAVIMFAVGAIASVVLLFDPVRQSSQAAVIILYFLALCAPIGLGLGVIFALLSGRRAR